MRFLVSGTTVSLLRTQPVKHDFAKSFAKSRKFRDAQSASVTFSGLLSVL